MGVESPILGGHDDGEGTMNFRYRGRDAGGSVVEGQVEAENQGMAMEALRQRGVVVLLKWRIYI